MALKNVKTVGAPFSNAAELVEVQYDFAKDGGAVGSYDALIADGACMIEFLYLHVETGVTSEDALTLDLGKGDGGDEYFDGLAITAIADPEDIVAPTAENRFVELTNGEKIVMGIVAHAATAGKFHMVFRVYKKQF